ncbi:CmcI family methyltransferase [Nocardia sp. CY41]|uniref:CmcI family methyltransferase n=1 Tax=Nocardia sp. CY41 TaxID=2608686 RepID=UPI00135A362A|nr:CmcI family methyltransferase [Nocardia sp. CY41]
MITSQRPEFFPATSDSDLLPDLVTADRHDRLLSYWQDRARQHGHDMYAGVRLKKFPEDLRVFEHLMWLSRSQIVIDLGTCLGGSALWFRDRLRALAHYGRVPSPVRVISVDLNQDRTRKILRQVDPDFDRDITLIDGDVTDPELADEVAGFVPTGARCLVVEDTLHQYATTSAALRHFSDFVPVGGFFIVEDGIVDDPDLQPQGMPGGVLPATRDWLATTQGQAFQVRRDLELYGITCHLEGLLQRTAT